MDTIETIARRHSMLKKLAPALILASVIGTVAGGATTASAETWRVTTTSSWNDYDRHGRWNNNRNHSSRRAVRAPARRHVLEKRIDRRVKNTTLPLRRMFDLGRDYKGYRIDAIVVKLRSKSRKGRVKLLVNGRAVDGQRVRGDETVRLRLNDSRVIGKSLKSLKLNVRGKMFIKNIKIKMSRIPNRRHSAIKRHSAPVDTNITRRTAEQIARQILRQIRTSWRHQ
jgi:hypothetical protein